MKFAGFAMKNAKFIFGFVILTSIFFFAATNAHSQNCSNETDCNKLIEDYSNQITKLQGQSNTLKNQIGQFDAQIKLTSLKIQKTEEQIGLLSGRITQVNGSLDSLTKAFSERAVETYKMAKMGDPLTLLITADNLNQAFDRFSYLKKIQEGDKSLLDRLQKAQTTYVEEKTNQEELQKQLATQQQQLNSQKLAKNTLLEQTKNDEKKYQSLLAEARAQLSALNRFVSNQGGASILSNQTKCDSWGCYYNQRDSQWGNIGLGGSSYSVANYGCLVTSVAMMASHYGKDIKPSDIATNSLAFVPNTGYLYHSFSVKGVNITISPASKSILDGELSAGRPVIAGLYSGPDHFIVILRKDGDKYIMNDPFLENGSEKPLTDKYNVSDINSLRLVSFN
jgi:peptidoglycan hydrolase CwlO-like protein